MALEKEPGAHAAHRVLLDAVQAPARYVPGAHDAHASKVASPPAQWWPAGHGRLASPSQYWPAGVLAGTPTPSAYRFTCDGSSGVIATHQIPDVTGPGNSSNWEMAPMVPASAMTCVQFPPIEGAVPTETLAPLGLLM